MVSAKLEILIDKFNQRNIPNWIRQTLFYENFIYAFGNRWHADVAESNFDVRKRVATSVDSLTRIKGYPPSGNLCWIRIIQFAGSLISEQPGWTTEQKRLTHVYVRDITEIQFTSNLDANRESRPDVNGNQRYNRDVKRFYVTIIKTHLR